MSVVCDFFPPHDNIIMYYLYRIIENTISSPFFKCIFDRMTKCSLKATFKNYLNSSQKLYTEYTSNLTSHWQGAKIYKKKQSVVPK